MMNDEMRLKKIDDCVEWIRRQVSESHTKGVLVGLSGGIDSSVVGHLLVRAFPENSIGVILPIDSNEEDAKDAYLIAEQSKINHIEIDLSDEKNLILKKIEEAIENSCLTPESQKKIVDANLRARMRMSALYSIANYFNYLVVGTDNLAELYTGYFTKYGDGGVDILPIASLTKQEVFQWARLLNVPKSILNKKPSAGLWEGQSDEEEMGISYDTIDRFLMGEKISFENEKKLIKMHTQTEHKRKVPPIFEG